VLLARVFREALGAERAGGAAIGKQQGVTWPGGQGSVGRVVASLRERYSRHMAARAASILAFLVPALIASESRAAGAETIIRTSELITAFEQEDHRLAWALGGCGEVQVHNLRTRSTQTVSRLRCDGIEHHSGVDGLSLAGRRALWRTVFDFPCTNFVGDVYTATTSSPQRRIDVHTYCAGIAADGDGGTLVFSRTELFGGGATYRVDREGRRERLRDVPDTRKLAAAAGRIALVPRRGGPTVEIRDAATGTLISALTPSGPPQGIALASRRAAVLVRNDDGSKRIEWYGLDGGLLGGVDVSDRAYGLDMAGRRVVFLVRRTVRVLDTATGDRQIVARPRREPVGPSIEGRRVAWAENSNGRGRVKAVVL
jgi:hypothetical protein